MEPRTRSKNHLGPLDSGEHTMKRFLLGAVIIPLLLTLTAGAADSRHARTGTTQHLQPSVGNGPNPQCRVGTNCDPSKRVQQQMASEGGPIPWCRPGANCDPAERVQQQMASEGGPIPWCRPGANCDPAEQVQQQMASEGGPIPWCRPGANCDPAERVRTTAGRGAESGQPGEKAGEGSIEMS
jgi:hypothetical protein